jgi:hypothetical protein
MSALEVSRCSTTCLKVGHQLGKIFVYRSPHMELIVVYTLAVDRYEFQGEVSGG